MGEGRRAPASPRRPQPYLSGAPAVEGAEGAAVVWPERVVLRRLRRLLRPPVTMRLILLCKLWGGECGQVAKCLVRALSYPVPAGDTSCRGPPNLKNLSVHIEIL